MKEYDHTKLEKKWQKQWEKSGIYEADDKSKKPKFYALIEFPYPSGDGLHVGHVRSNTAMDVISRKRRMEGANVLYPIGWDAFGLPTENYAIKTGIHPTIVTKQNTDNFRKQLKSLGFGFDWSREIDTTDPEYYKWTQWIFLKFLEKNLAYKKRMTINWCPKDKIGLANEEVVDGKCERCGTAVEKREKEQWMLAITKYADRLDRDLDTVDFLEKIKTQQRNWIGKSEGAEVDFGLNWPSPTGEIVFATNNEGKVKRMQKLFKEAGIQMILKTPKDIGIMDFDVVEDGLTLKDNAEKKARALGERTDLGVLADDTGFFIDGAEIDPVKVKRNALGAVDEKSLTVEEIAKRMQAYYKDLAHARGGKVDAEWRNALCFLTPEKFAINLEAVRPVTLTDESHGDVDPHLPLRGLYVPKATGKYALEQTAAEELIEMFPITQTIKKMFTPSIKVFTTRIDTLFGVTYLVLAPEHPFVSACIIKKILKNTAALKAYVEGAKNKTEIERTAENKEKTGVVLEGVKAINPASGEEIPIFVADYVLGAYGTGAIMAVPAHDERDLAFAKTHKLPVKMVIEPIFEKKDGVDAFRPDKPVVLRKAVMIIIKHWEKDEFLCVRWNKINWNGYVTGGIEEGESAKDAALREITEETGYVNATFVRQIGMIHSKFYHQVKQLNRFAHFDLVYVELKNGEKREILADEKAFQAEVGSQDVWTPRAQVRKFVNRDDLVYAWDLFEEKVGGQPAQAFISEEGQLANSGEFNGLTSEEAKNKIAAAVGAKIVTNYKLRDWIFSRQRYWGEPIPVVHCAKCGIVPVPEKDLPVKLPNVKNYQPTDNGESPLAAMTNWVNTKCPRCKGPAKRETDTMPNWAGSSWYYLRYIDPKNKKTFASKDLLKHWTPVDWYNGGMEHTTLHLLYSRFWHKFLFDLGLVPTSEPYAKRTSQGLILASDGEKISKSKGNGVKPDEIVATFGADSLRLYEMFMGPFDQPVAWNTDNIVGVRRFIERVWKLQSKVANGVTLDAATDVLLQKTIKKVTEDIEGMRFNTCVSSLMILLNDFEKTHKLSQDAFETFLKLLAPFAPHVTEDLWAGFGNKASIHLAPWPAFDVSKLVESTKKITVQVNGKSRAQVEVAADIADKELEAAAFALPEIKKWTDGKQIKKIIVIKGKLISIVVGE